MSRGIPKGYDISDLPSYMDHFMNRGKRGAVYFLVAEDLSLVKIGGTNTWRSSLDGMYLDMETRVRELQKKLFVPARLAVITMATPAGSEQQHHDYFEAFRYRQDREWFWLVDELKDYVERLAQWEQQMELYVTEHARYEELLRIDPKAEENGTILQPTLPLKGPWLDFKSGVRPKPRRTPSGWEVKFSGKQG